jgi:hypothetical protein
VFFGEVDNRPLQGRLSHEVLSIQHASNHAEDPSRFDVAS